MKHASNVTLHFFGLGQLNGLWGSSGPSQSTSVPLIFCEASVGGQGGVARESWQVGVVGVAGGEERIEASFVVCEVRVIEDRGLVLKGDMLNARRGRTWKSSSSCDWETEIVK